MKLELALNSFFEQIYDVAYKGKNIPKEAFRCASIDDNNYSVEDMGNSDPYPAFANHITMNVAPILEKGLEKSTFTIHEIDGQQGEIHPHFVLRRKDFAILNDHDCTAMLKVIKSTIDKNNAANRQNTNVTATTCLFGKKDQNKTESSALDTPEPHHYHLRHK